ncbi:MAG TPA: hypothetical protein PKZ50_11130 [Bacteroidales bacterium]|nr:hypothetical protein [Bacteroidales bacterium]
MNDAFRNILIAVAHPSEEQVVSVAASHAGMSCEIIVTGVGGAAMSWALQKRFASGDHPSLVMGAGLAGSYVESIRPGAVVTTVSDCFADMGIDDNGRFVPLFGAGLADPDMPPFSGGRIHCSGRGFDLAAGLMPAVRGATVNMVSGSQSVIDRICRAWDPDIETMEGAWLAYTCAMSGIPWIAVKAISNMVEPRNMKNWKIRMALGRLQEKMTLLFELMVKS